MKQEQGFTLVELMIVVAILAILSALAVTVYQQSIAKAQLSEAFTVLDGLKTHVAAYRHQTGLCPINGTAGIQKPGSYSGKYVGRATVTDPGSNGACMITAFMRAHTVAARLRNTHVSLTLDGHAGAIRWTCTSDIPAVYLPQVCR
jgi:type IV pilus assembly protein PilA